MPDIFHQMIIREAFITDIQQMQFVRNTVKENMLSNPNLVTEKDYEDYITIKGKGWVCEIENNIVGFAIADIKNNNIWALFVLPAFEKKGIGRKLHDTMLSWYFSQTKNTVWLSTAPNTSAEIFYRRLGWTEVGTHGTKEIKFEMRFENWQHKAGTSIF